MSVEQVLTLVSALSLAILTPGPSIIATIQTAFAHGRERALPYALGLACGASLWCLAALFGLALVFKLHPGWFSGFKVAGGCYLLWFAWRLWQSANQPLPAAAGGAKGFFGGITLNLSNPKPAMFYAALILSVFPAPLSAGHQAVLYAICLSTELFWYSTVAVLMSTATMRARYFAAKFWIDRAASLAMAVLGVLLIVKH
ncbi:LysE family translocator [Paracoccus limosus]|jgi:threonine/homoserine/homoserine lactone efflux protein|uniref:LysE family translocator n=1 Tax=Paracoccus limosus TaxID=913252 RepID=A0A844H159_9RHOB|nr:LysE family translocator [Paracoccus limosus]MTH33284.1 LysE family translocator [Paracoccus limosus]